MHMWSMFLDNKKMEGDKPLTAVETNYWTLTTHMDFGHPFM
jgi:hypothetical protein